MVNLRKGQTFQLPIIANLCRFTDITCLFFLPGAGTALSSIPAVVVVGFYFKKYLGVAVGVNVTGAGLGTFASGPLLHFFLDKYGVHGSFLLMACIVAQAVIFGALMIPSHLEMEAKIKNKMANDSSTGFKERCKNYFCIFKNKTFSLILLAFVLWSLPYGIILMHLPNYSISTGVSEENAALLITIFGLGSAINRILTGLTQGPGGLDPMLLFMGFQGLLGAITFLFPLVSKSFAGQVVYSFLFGIHTGGLVVLMNPVSIELVGLAQLPTSIGLMLLMFGRSFNNRTAAIRCADMCCCKLMHSFSQTFHMPTKLT